MVEKSDWQKHAESTGLTGYRYRLRVVKENPNSPAKVGEVVTAVRWGTFGCWDEQNRWIDFYSCEIVS